MKDIMQKLAELEATAPKVSKKKMLNEDSTTPPMNVSNKPASLKDVFAALSENIAPGQKPLPVLDPQKKQAGMGFVTSDNPAVQNMLKNLDPKDVQIVQAPGQAPAAGQQPQATAAGQPNPNQLQTGQQAVQEKDEGKPGKNFAKIAKSAGERYGSKEAGERVAGAVRAKLAKQGKLEEEGMDEGAKEWHDEMEQWALSKGQKNKGVKPALQRAADRDNDWALSHRKSDTVKEGAKVDRMVKHIEKSEKKLGKSKGEAEDIAWATANKRGMLDNKNKKAVKEGFYSVRSNQLKQELEKNGWERIPAREVPDHAKYGYRKNGVGRFYKVIDEPYHSFDVSFVKPRRVIDKLVPLDTLLELIRGSSVTEGDIAPTNGIDTRGAGLGAGRNPKFTEGKKPDANKDGIPDYAQDGKGKNDLKKKKKVDESMNHRISAARLEGKSHGLRGHAHSGKRYEDLDEIKAYHEGYKEGLDECYGQGVYETAPAMPAATVGGMADEEMLGELSPQTLQRAAGAARARGRWAASVDRQVGSTAHKNLAAKDMALAKKADAKAGVTDPTSPNPSYDWANKGGYGMDNDPALKPKYQSGMADDAMDEGNAFTAALAKTPKGGKFEVGGKTFTDRTNYDTKVDEYAFESLDNQLNALLTESEEVSEGLSVSISKGQQNSPDSVTITAEDQEAEHLLAFVKNAGLGLFGDDHDHSHSSAMSIQPAHGAPDEVGAGGVDIGVVDGHDGMMGLMQKLSGIQTGGADDYADEEGEEQLYGNHEAADKKDCGCDGDCECSDYDKPSNEGTCNECGTYEGVHEAGCSMGRGKEMVDEVESEDQMEFEVAEDNAPDSGAAETTADENAEAAEDSALAKSDSKGGTYTVNEEDDEKEEDVSEGFTFEGFYKKLAFLESTEKEDDKAEKAGKKVAKDIEYDEGHKGKDDDKAEKAGKKVTKDIEYDDKKDKKEKVDEWANNAGPGKTVSDTTFEQDIDFMTKVISGGLNKQKSTGQTTIPVIAGQTDRMSTPKEAVNESVSDWVKLAGIK